MSAAIALRADFTACDLRRLARSTPDATPARRLLALAAIYDGGSRSEAARTGGVGLQIVRDWVMRFNAEGPDGLIDRKAPGPTPRLNEEHRTALAAAGVERHHPGMLQHGAGSSHRERSDTRHSWRGALATDRSVPVAVGGVPRLCGAADAEPRGARTGLSQAHRPAAPSRPGCRCDRAF